MKKILLLLIICSTGLLYSQSDGVKVNGSVNIKPSDLRRSATDNAANETYFLHGNWSTGVLGYYKLNLQDTISNMISDSLSVLDLTLVGDIGGLISANTIGSGKVTYAKLSQGVKDSLFYKVNRNANITGATKTKITYDSKGLVTSGADATTADINDSSNRRYVTDAQLTVIGNTSGTNTGDQNLAPYLLSATAASTYLTQSNASSTYLTISNAASTYQPIGSYEVPLTFSTGLTRTTNTVTVNTSQNITNLTNLNTAGFVKTTGVGGALSIDNSTYLTTSSAGTTYLPLAGGTMTGNLLATNNTYDLGSAAAQWRTGYFGTSVIVSATPALSNSAALFSGTLLTGGSATTTKPMLLMEPTGNTSNNWFSAGTYIGLNAATGFTGNYIQGQINGSGRFYIDYTGKYFGSAADLSGNINAISATFPITATTGNGLSVSGSTLTTGNMVSIDGTSTANSSNTATMLKVSSSGAHVASSVTKTGISSVVTNTGTSSTNVAGYFSASGGTNNYAAQFVGGNGGGLTFGDIASDYGAIWSKAVTPSASNYAFTANATNTVYNAVSQVLTQIGGILKTTVNSTSAIFTLGGTTGSDVSITNSTVTSGNLLSIVKTGTAALTNATGINVSFTGASAASSVTSYGAQISNTSTGTTSTNYGLYINVSGATTNIPIFARQSTTGDQLVGQFGNYGGAAYKSYINIGAGADSDGTSATWSMYNDPAATTLSFLYGNSRTGVGASLGFRFNYLGAGILGASLTTPLIIGGTGTTSTLTLQSTSGVGTTNADIIFKVGNNGATEAMRILNSGNVGFGISPTAYLTLKAGTATASTAPLKLTTGTLNTTAEAGAYEYNNVHYETKSSGLRYAKGGVIADFYTDVNNSGTGETDLYTYTTPASTLAADGSKLTATFSGTFNDVTATSQLQIYFGGTVIANTGALTVSATGGWKADVLIIRTGATTARAIVSINTPGASTALYTSETDITGLTLTNTNIIKITGTAGGASGGSNDITGKLGTIMWFGPAAN